MPRNRKVFINNTAIFLTTRVEEGLPLVPNELMNAVLWGILARAQSLYKVRISHFLFMTNHFHMLVVVDNPEDIPLFMRYVKSESSHAINIFLGRTKKTIWEDGYDSPRLLTLQDAFRYVRYIYLNPQKANLVEDIDDYPAISSWKMFVNDQSVIQVPIIRRKSLFKLSKTSFTWKEAKRILKKLLIINKGEASFVLEPKAIFDCFEESIQYDYSEIKKELIHEIYKSQNEMSARRRSPVVGAEILVKGCMLKTHQPASKGIRMICISSDKKKRKSFICWFKSICRSAKVSYHRLINGLDFEFIPGLFLPGGKLKSNLYAAF